MPRESARRRQFLRALTGAAAVGLAGCGSDSSSEPNGTTESLETTETRTPTATLTPARTTTESGPTNAPGPGGSAGGTTTTVDAGGVFDPPGSGDTTTAPTTTEQQGPRRVADFGGGGRYGNAVALDGDIALVGANEADPGPVDAGEVHAYVRSGGEWRHDATLVADDGREYDGFGVSLALDGNTALVGAKGHDTEDDINWGAAYVFERADGGWVQRTKLLPEDVAAGEEFGHAVALDGDSALVSTVRSGLGEEETGAVYAFERADGTWQSQQKLVPTDADDGDQFGSSVALAADAAVVGAVTDETNSTKSGSAYVFERGDGEWRMLTKITDDNGTDGDDFGRSVAVQDTTVLVGAQDDDSVSVFGSDGNGLGRRATLTGDENTSESGFGMGVDLDNDTAVVGAGFENAHGVNTAGAAYVFERADGEWARRARLAAAGQAYDRFGTSVAVSGGSAIVGAVGAGNAYVFDL